MGREFICEVVENVLELNIGDGCLVGKSTKNTELIHFKRVNFTICELSLNLKK